MAALLLVLGVAWECVALPGGGFIENVGRVNSGALYYGDCGSATVFFTRAAVVIDFREYEKDEPNGGDRSVVERAVPKMLRGHALFLEFVDANPAADVEARYRLPGEHNYFLGNDRTKWITGVGAYEEIVYHDLWPGVDMVYRFRDGRLEYEARLADGADPDVVRIACVGADDVTVTSDGQRTITTCVGRVLERYVSGDGIRGEFLLQTGGGEPAFDGGRDDPSTVPWGTYFGGSIKDDGWCVGLDSSGNIVIGGGSHSGNLPTTPGVYQPSDTNSPWGDCFVAKLDGTGSSLIWCTYIGALGSGNTGNEVIFNLVLDPDDNVVASGQTNSWDFPTTAGAFDTGYNGWTDAFVLKLSADATTIMWSTFLGGSGDEWAIGVDLDSSQNVYVTGETAHSSFPTTPGAFDETYNGGDLDAFVSKLSADGSTLLYSTFVGGSDRDYGENLVVSALDECFVTGGTESTNFPVTLGAFDTSHNGGYGPPPDAFVAKITPLGDDLEWCTYLGGSDHDAGLDIELDADGNPVVAGETNSGNYPTTPGAFDETAYSYCEAFVTKLDASGASLIWSTYYCGYRDQRAWELEIDVTGCPVIVGRTDHRYSLPVTPDAYSSSGGASGWDGFIVKFDPTASTLRYASYIPANGELNPYGLVLDALGDAIVGGSIWASNLPGVHGGSYDSSHNGEYDAFLLKFDLPGPPENIVCDPVPLIINVGNDPGTIDVEYLTGGSGLLYAYSITFSWDGAVAATTPGQVTERTLLSDVGSTQFLPYVSGTNEITVDCALLGATDGAAGPGTMFTIEFDGVALGVSDVELTVVEARDRYNTPLSGFVGEDGEIQVDIVAPVISDVALENVTLGHTDEYAKNGDEVILTATVVDDHGAFGASNIRANLQSLGGDAAQTPDGYDGSTATWTTDIDAVACNPANDLLTITVDATDPLGNPAVQGSDDITSDNIAPTAILGFAAAPGHNKAELSWDDPTLTDTNPYKVMIRSNAWTDYPTYGVGLTPSYPADAGDGTFVWEDMGMSHTATYAGDGSERDIYYYGAFASDMVLHYGPAAGSAQDRSTNYWLGDVVTDATWGTYDGLVTMFDIDKLAGTYAQIPSDPFDQCDVGPTNDMSRVGIPEPDALVDFEDAMVFAMNYGVVAPKALPSKEPRDEAVPLALILKERATTPDLEVALHLRGNNDLVKGLSAVVGYDATELEFVNARLSDRLAADPTPEFLWYGSDGSSVQVDLAVLGTEMTIEGSGDVAYLTFRPMSDGYTLVVEDAELRGADNEALDADIEGVESKPELPTVFRLAENVPNPFNPVTSIRFDVPRESAVTIRIYDVAGRLVRTLVDGMINPGRHSEAWDGRDDHGEDVGSGVYFCTMEAPEFHGSRKMLLLK
jgi:hypothetical protein